MITRRDSTPCARASYRSHPRSRAGIITMLGGITTLFAATALAEPESPGGDQPSVPADAAPASELPPQPVAPPPAPATQAMPPPSGAVMRPVQPAPEHCEREEGAVEGVGEFLVGPGLFDVSSLNDRLAANGYQRLSSLATVIGGEGHAVFENGFVAGARGAALISPSRTGPSDMQTQLSGGFGMVDFGYAFVHTQPILLALTAGIGGYGRSLGIGDGKSASFDDVLKNPTRSVSLDQGGVLVGLTLALDGRIPTGEVRRGRRSYVTVGLRIAGLYGPSIGGWSISQGSDATAAPSVGLSGGYAALAIGFGGGSVPASPSKNP